MRAAINKPLTIEWMIRVEYTCHHIMSTETRVQPSSRKPTSRDVADLAGVSQTTVSYVMSGKRPVSEASRQLVLAAMDQLGYRPNASAQALRARRPKVIGVVVPYRRGADSAAQHRIMTHLVRRARFHDYDVLMLTTDEGEAGIRRVAETNLCSGLVVMEVTEDDPRAACVAELSIPSVFMGVVETRGSVACVDADYESAASQAVSLLAQVGDHQLTLVEPADESVCRLGFIERFHRSAMSTAQQAGRDVRVVRTGAGLPRACAALGRLANAERTRLLLAPLVSADDWINALELAGQHVGQDYQLIASGWDKQRTHALIQPTFFDMRNDELTAIAVDQLIDLINGSAPSLPSRFLLRPRLIPGMTSPQPRSTSRAV